VKTSRSEKGRVEIAFDSTACATSDSLQSTPYVGSPRLRDLPWLPKEGAQSLLYRVRTRSINH